MQEIIVVGAGASVGVAQTVIFRQYVDGFGNFPLIGDMLPHPWGKWSTFGNILIGGIAFGLTQFTDIIADKSHDLNQFLKIYGMSVLVGGLMNGIFPSEGLVARSGYVATLPGGRNGHISDTYYPGYTGTFVERSATKAKGFGSDIHRNPMAAIPTEIPSNKINY